MSWNKPDSRSRHATDAYRKGWEAIDWGRPRKNSVTPYYDSKDYEDFVEMQKSSGLLPKYWNLLPQMWKEELKFRDQFESSLRDFSALVGVPYGNYKPPWMERPFQLITWMDILKFSASSFYKAANTLAGLDALAEDFIAHHKTKPPRAGFSDRLREMVENVRNDCATISLTMSIKSADRLVNEIKAGASWEQIWKTLNELNGRIRDEISDNLFLFIPRTHASYFDAGAQPFGMAVATAFPSTAYDIEESGKCLALRRSTACVFHAMRVLEHGLCALMNDLGLAVAQPSWNEMIEQIEAEIKRRRKAGRKAGNTKNEEQLHSEAAAQFMHFKNAWRNHAAHSGTKYTEDEAEAIYRHVRDFMVHLSKKLKEVPVS